MKRLPVHGRGATGRDVFAFTVRHWSRQPARLAIIMTAMLASTLADVLMPLYSGRLIDAVSRAANAAAPASAAVVAFSVPIALALGSIAMRHVALIGLNDLVLKMIPMSRPKRSIMCSAFQQTGMQTASPARQCAR